LGSYNIAHVKDVKGSHFSTRVSNILVIGDAKSSVISLPKGEGIKLSLIEERAIRLPALAEEENDEDED